MQLEISLKVPLNSFKLAPESNQTRGIMIGDRTPEPGIVSDHFDDMYELGKKIGEGASGSVYLCKSKANGKNLCCQYFKRGRRTFENFKKSV
jgi:hypothetical protein